MQGAGKLSIAVDNVLAKAAVCLPRHYDPVNGTVAFAIAGNEVVFLFFDQEGKVRCLLVCLICNDATNRCMLALISCNVRAGISEEQDFRPSLHLASDRSVAVRCRHILCAAGGSKAL